MRLRFSDLELRIGDPVSAGSDIAKPVLSARHINYVIFAAFRFSAGVRRLRGDSDARHGPNLTVQTNVKLINRLRVSRVRFHGKP